MTARVQHRLLFLRSSTDLPKLRGPKVAAQVISVVSPPTSNNGMLEGVSSSVSSTTEATRTNFLVWKSTSLSSD